MKKKSLLIIAITALTACTSNDLTDDSICSEKPKIEQQDPNHRSFAEALEIAQNSIKILDNSNQSTRVNNTGRTLYLKNGVRAVKQLVTRADGNVSPNDTLLYVFNFNDDQGFAVVSASRQTDGLIAVTEEGFYDPNISTGNPAFDTYMQMAKAYVAYKDRTPLVDNSETTRATTHYNMYKPVYDTVFYQKIEPKVNVKWGQRGQTGKYCPNKVAGCSNVAVAQIMSYYKYPTSIKLDYPEKDAETTELNWEDICTNPYTYYIIGYSPAFKQIGRLARQIGYLAYSNYDIKKEITSTKDSQLRTAIQSLGYSIGQTNLYKHIIAKYVYNHDVGYPLATALSNNKLIYMRGENSKGIGHSWIVDGCYYVKCIYSLMGSNDGINWFVDHEIDTYRTCHNHINWGLDGKGNGYFNSEVLDAFNPLEKDNEKDAFLEEELTEDHNYYTDVKYFTIWHE